MQTARHLRVHPLTGVAILAAAFAAYGQEPEAEQQSDDQGVQQQRDDEELRVALASPSQEPPPSMSWNQVRMIHVKSDRVTDFEDRLKDLSAAMTKQGRSFNVWQVALGELNTYHIVSPIQSFTSIAQFESNPPMERAQWTSWLERMRSTIDSQAVAVAQVHQDLSIMPQNPQQATNADLLILVSNRVMPAKRQQYQSWLRDELLPAFRGSEIAGLISNEVTFGPSSGEWVFAVPVASWADLDKPMPLFESMGQQAAEQLLERGAAMIEDSETLVLRSRPDLSAMATQSAPQQSSGQPR